MIYIIAIMAFILGIIAHSCYASLAMLAEYCGGWRKLIRDLCGTMFVVMLTGCTSTNFIVSKTTWNGEHEEKFSIEAHRISFAQKILVEAGIDGRGMPVVLYGTDGGKEAMKSIAEGVTAGALTVSK